MQLGGYGWLLDLAKSTIRSRRASSTPRRCRTPRRQRCCARGGAPTARPAVRPRCRSTCPRRPCAAATGSSTACATGRTSPSPSAPASSATSTTPSSTTGSTTIRVAALQARGIAGEPTAIVDGVLAARAFSRVTPTDQEEDFRAAVRSTTNPTGTDPIEDARRAAVRRCLRRVAADLDAVADLTMAQSVHSLLQDNSEAASAALAVTGGGDGSVPPIDVTSTAARRPADQPPRRGDVDRQRRRARPARRSVPPNRG